MDIKADLTFLQKHERLLITFALIIALSWGFNAWINKSAHDADLRASVAEQALTEQKETVKQLEGIVKDQQTQYNAIQQEVTQLQAALNNAIAVRNTQVVQQKEIDKNLPLSDLAQRWKMLVILDNSDIVSQSDTVVLSDVGARKTVFQLEEVPVLQANVADLNKITEAKDNQIKQANEVITSQSNQINGLKSQIEKADVVAKEQIDAVKADARKSKKNWFLKGLAVGGAVVGYLLLH